MNETLRLTRELIKYRYCKKRDGRKNRFNRKNGQIEYSAIAGGSDASKRTAKCN